TRQLASLPPALELPADRRRPIRATYRGGLIPFALPAPLTNRVIELARGEDATLFMTLLAAYVVLLARLSGQHDIVVGTPIAGRTQVETEDLIGFFVNTIALRIDLSDAPTFREVLARVQAAALEAYMHQEIPFERLVDALEVERDVSRSPVFQVMFVFE